MRTISRFLRDQTAATAVEYGLITAGIAVAIIGVVNSVGSSISTVFTTLASSLK